MSINSLANAAAARRPDTGPTIAPPTTLHEIAEASATSPAKGRPGHPGGNDVATPASVDTAFNVLFGYIPTEVITLYVAVLAAIENPDPNAPGNRGAASSLISDGDWITFWSFLLATPIVVWLVYGAKLKIAQKPVPLHLSTWPMWEMTAATIAFSAWAFALPHSPFSFFTWYSSALSGVAVLIVSTLLGLLSPFFQRPLKVGPDVKVGP